MDFLNEQIEAGQLPNALLVNWQPVEKDYLKLLRLQWALFSTVLLIVSVVLVIWKPRLQEFLPLLLIAIAWLLIMLLYFFLQEKSFSQLAYAVRDHDILYRHGWLLQRIIACPFNRVQHCSTGTGLLSRIFKLSTLTLFTAGAGGADIRIAGMNETTAQNLREFIMTKIKSDGEDGN